MKKKDQKALKEKILVAFKKVLLVNKADLTDKIEKAVKKSIKKIVKKANEKKEKFSIQKTKKSASNSPKIKTGKQLPK
ncbi:MAG: hypothetical protein Q7W13_02190 [Bacteroidia bacterium]|nr:hypothetical protein [Bacteroidia bacterium]